MESFKSLAILSLAAFVLVGAWQVIAADGWLAGGVFLAGALLIISLFCGIFDLMFRLFSRRRGD